jgi:hypothetical protein
MVFVKTVQNNLIINNLNRKQLSSFIILKLYFFLLYEPYFFLYVF